MHFFKVYVSLDQLRNLLYTFSPFFLMCVCLFCMVGKINRTRSHQAKFKGTLHIKPKNLWRYVSSRQSIVAVLIICKVEGDEEMPFTLDTHLSINRLPN